MSDSIDKVDLLADLERVWRDEHGNAGTEAAYKRLRDRLAALQPEAVAESEAEPRSCREDDGCPTEGAVLRREWREMKFQLTQPEAVGDAGHPALQVDKDYFNCPTCRGVGHVDDTTPAAVPVSDALAVIRAKSWTVELEDGGCAGCVYLSDIEDALTPAPNGREGEL